MTGGESDRWSTAGSGSTERLRLFVAIDLEPGVRAGIHDRASRLYGGMRSVRIPPRDGLHLTLKFLGDVEEERAGALADAVRETARSGSPFEIAIGDPGRFPARGPVRVLWMGIVEREGRLVHLARRIDAACVALGFPAERRPFHPHVTVGRCRVGARILATPPALGVGELPVGGADRQLVSEIVLKRSELRPEGAMYSDLAVCPLEHAP